MLNEAALIPVPLSPSDVQPPAGGSKSSGAYRTIGEVAAELGLPAHVLRFWESKFSQIKPHKRRGGHRYYRPADIEVLREVKSLLYERGFTIKGAQKYLREMKKQGGEIAANDTELSVSEAGSVNDNFTGAGTGADDMKQLQQILDGLMQLRETLEFS